MTGYGYDALERVTSVTTPLGKTTSYGYDPDGNRTTVTDPDGRLIGVARREDLEGA